MNTQSVMEDFSALPPEAQRQVADFIKFMQTRYQTQQTTQTQKPNKPISEESFIGMWRDREDMRDSSQWVRDLRCSEKTMASKLAQIRADYRSAIITTTALAQP